MAIPYSNDLRRKVINLIKQGKKQNEIAELLSINKATILDGIKDSKKLVTLTLKVIITIVIKLKSNQKS